MLDFTKLKISLILSICLLSIWYAAPSLLGNKLTGGKLARLFSANTVNLGLDLRGGSHILLNVDFASYLKDNLTILQDSIRQELRKNKIGYANLKNTASSIQFRLRSPEQISLLERKIYKLSKHLEINKKDGLITLNYHKDYINELKKNLLEQSIEIVRRRVDETGTKEPSIQRQGDLNILLQVPGITDPKQLKNMLGKTAKLTFHLLDESGSKHAISSDSMLLPGEQDSDGNSRFYVVKKKSLLSGDLLVDSTPSFNEFGAALVEFSFNSLGAQKFAQITKENIGKPLAIVLDNKVITAPIINGPIMGGKGSISGNFSVEEAKELSLLLRAGALPAPLNVIEERIVGPSLGIDSIEAGKLAGLVAALSITIFMVWTYGIFGLFATIAMVMNIIILIALLALLQATLTMPGIAGIVLTMGMAVDANVLIFERIREDLKQSNSIFSAINSGFQRALTTILDSNITTILVGIILYYFGSGTVKGFAVTLIFGILASMFSAITLTRLMVFAWFKFTKPKKLII